MELGHFDKHFVENTQQKAPQGNIIGVFPSNTAKSLNLHLPTIRASFSKLGHFL